MPDQTPTGGNPTGEPQSLNKEQLAQSAAREAVRGSDPGGGGQDNFGGPTDMSPPQQPAAGETLESETGQYVEQDREPNTMTADTELKSMEEYKEDQGRGQDTGQEEEFAEASQQERAQRTEAEKQEIERQAQQAGFSDEDVEQLRQMGIDVPVKPSEVPDEVRPQYSQMVQTLVNREQSAQRRELQAQEQIMQVQDFAHRLEESPDDVLLTLALNNTDAFQDAVRKFQRMQDDEEFAETMKMRLEAEARQRAADRKEQVMTQQQRQQKAQRVRTETHRLARQHGVSPQRAEQFVADRIVRNRQQEGRADITGEEIQSVVSSLAQQNQPQQPSPQAKSPQTQQRERQAPTNQTEGAGQPAQETQGTGREATAGDQQRAKGSTPRSIGDAVKRAAERVRSKGL